jgi:hypothetical protein
MAGRNGEMHALEYKGFSFGSDSQGNELIIIKFKRTKTFADNEDQKTFVTSPLEISILKRYLQLWKESNDPETTTEFFKSVRLDYNNNIVVGKQNIGYNTLSNFNKNIAKKLGYPNFSEYTGNQVCIHIFQNINPFL